MADSCGHCPEHVRYFAVVLRVDKHLDPLKIMRVEDECERRRYEVPNLAQPTLYKPHLSFGPNTLLHLRSLTAGFSV